MFNVISRHFYESLRKFRWLITYFAVFSRSPAEFLRIFHKVSLQILSVEINFAFFSWNFTQVFLMFNVILRHFYENLRKFRWVKTYFIVFSRSPAEFFQV